MRSTVRSTRPSAPTWNKSATSRPQADPPPCGQTAEDPALSREFVPRGCSASWGRRPARCGHWVEHAFRTPAQARFSTLRHAPPRGALSTACGGRSGPLESRRGPGRPGLADRSGPPAEPRCRGVGSRGHDALPRRDRGGQRDPRRERLLPREPQQDLPGCARTVCPGRARRRDHARRRARAARRARGRGRSEPRPRARHARARERERRATTRASSARWRPCAG